MNNIELEEKVLEIIKEDNYFEMIIKAKAFESEYKKSDFYKITKKPFEEVIKESKIYYALQLKDFGRQTQRLINSLDLTKVMSLLDQMGGLFATENEEIKENLEVLKDLHS